MPQMIPQASIPSIFSIDIENTTEIKTSSSKRDKARNHHC